MADELKPCPFCGGEAEYLPHKITVRCTRCHANIKGRKMFTPNINYEFWLKQLWNRRINNG